MTGEVLASLMFLLIGLVINGLCIYAVHYDSKRRNKDSAPWIVGRVMLTVVTGIGGLLVALGYFIGRNTSNWS
jgi:hypothetical protein